jgi:hypothetical protein
MNNFGPAVGFAWNVPWFGEGKTTIRGGYQVTFQGGGRFNTLQGPLAAPPGSTLDPATPNWQNVYRDLASVPTELPITTVCVADAADSVGSSDTDVYRIRPEIRRSVRAELDPVGYANGQQEHYF